jgi:hypothetical protein
MERRPTPSPWQRHLLVALPLLALPLIIFWRSNCFYILDDWTALIQMVQKPFGPYLVTPDGEQWFPFFHLVYYGLVAMAGERYGLLVFINCLGTGVNAFLVYLFFRRHWGAGQSLVLSLFYAGAAVHHAIIWNGFYVGYLLSLAFFLGALLLTDSYLREPSAFRLTGIGLCAGLSILSHNYPLVGLLALPLYALLLGGAAARRRFWALTGVIGLVYLLFTAGYLTFAGLPAATSHNGKIFAGLPGPAYLLHIFYGAFLSPFFYLFWGHYHFPIAAYVAGVTLLVLSLAAIWRWGGSPEKRLALWALLANALPFVLVSLTRYQRSVNQAFVARYGIFTLIGALLLIGTAWRLLAARYPRRKWTHALALGLVAVMACGQLFSLPRWTQKYREMSQTARNCYALLNQAPAADRTISREDFRKFCPTAHPTLTRSQAVAIHRFLNRVPGAS